MVKKARTSLSASFLFSGSFLTTPGRDEKKENNDV